ncbi:MAG: DUF1080 domain-containing protein, partial [Planctomycetes bacterium]|nr:DUF1080 domain-containing protein [Planctomycetota bacterium]
MQSSAVAVAAPADREVVAHEPVAGELRRFEYRKVIMAIEARIVLYAPDDETADAAASAAFAELERLDGVFSDYREDSELMRLCTDGAIGRDLELSEDVAWVLGLSTRAYRESAGAFDPSVGALTRIWRPALRGGRLPALADVSAAVQHVGLGRAWKLRSEIRDQRSVSMLTLGQAGVRFDVGGIAKGYAVGMAFDTVRALGLQHLLIEMGGDIVVGDRPPGEVGWRVDVQRPDGGRCELVLENAALFASGDASQGVEIDGVRFSHVIDPRSGWPLSNGLACTLVQPFGQIAPFGNRPGHQGPFLPAITALADARATAATIIGHHEGRRIALEEGASYLAISDPSFRPLFDGTSLSAWTPRGGRYDGDALWSVEDGAITGRPGPGDAGGLLYTQAPFTSFELQLECKLEAPFDSGIFVRMTPDARGAQLTLDDRPDGEIGALFSDGFLAHARPEAAAAWRRGEWNHVFLRCTGFDMRLEAWINGVPVMDHVVPQEFGPDGRPVFAPSGLIGLQVHGGGSEGAGHKVQFRDITIRELPLHGEDFARDRALAPPEREARASRRAAGGWRDLLAPPADGSDPLSAWEDVHDDGPPHAPADYFVRDGVLHIPSSDPPGYLRTKADFRDFDLTLQFRQARMSNSGLFLRGRRDAPGADGAVVPGGNPAFSGCEIQVIDDWNWEAGTQSTLKDWQFTGSLYGAVPPARKGLLAPIGEWNTLEVTARGSRMACALNGQALWDVDTHALAVDPPFAQRAAAGFLGLQRYAAPGVTDAAALEVREL